MMNALTNWNRLRWNQSNKLEASQHTLRSLFSRSRRQRPEENARAAQWIPLVDVSENAGGYVLRAELPQVKQEDVKLGLEDGTLTITGDRKFNQNCKKDHRVEHACGRFAHSFVLPTDARPAKVSSVLINGILTVHVAKNGCGPVVARPRASLFSKNQPLKKNESENEHETALIPR
jgi:HSP20 family protein